MKLHQNQLFLGTQLNEKNLREFNFKETTFLEGITIYRENDLTTSLFLILEGDINLITHQELEPNFPNSLILSQGSFFGYDEHYNSTKRYSRAIALTNTKIIVVPINELNNLIVNDLTIIDNLKKNIHFPLLVAKKEEEISKNSPNSVSDNKNFSNDMVEKDFIRMQSEIIKEKEMAEKEIDSKFSELNKKEAELLQLKETLHREKLFAEQTLQEELVGLEKKEQSILLSEKSFEKEKIFADSTLKMELEKLNEKEAELEKKSKIIEKEKIMLSNSIEKAKELALNEIELMRKFKTLSNKEKQVDDILGKEKELTQRESKIIERLKKLDEKEEAVLAVKSLKSELEEKEKELDSKLKKIEEKKAAIDNALKKEKSLTEKKSELEFLEQKLNMREKLFDEQRAKFNELVTKEESLTELEKELNLKLETLQKAEEKLYSVNRKNEEFATMKADIENKTLIGHEKPLTTTNAIDVATYLKLPNGLDISPDRIQPFQHFQYEFISIVIVNLSRCTSEKAVNFKNLLTTVFESNSKKIILDISFSEFLDSTFLGVMVVFLKQLRRNNREMRVIVELNKMTATTLALSGLDKVFTLEEDLNTAFYDFYNE